MKTKEQQTEHRILRIMGSCEHFAGIQNTTCKAGVNIRQLVGGPELGWATRTPCLLDYAENCNVQCGSRSLPTREEAEKEFLQEEAQFERVMKCMRAAKGHAKEAGLGRGNGGRGELPCPTECGGVLHYYVASFSGHMHAGCSTSGCVSWME